MEKTVKIKYEDLSSELKEILDKSINDKKLVKMWMRGEINKQVLDDHNIKLAKPI